MPWGRHGTGEVAKPRDRQGGCQPSAVQPGHDEEFVVEVILKIRPILQHRDCNLQP